MHREQKERICMAFRGQEFFLPSTFQKFLKESGYRNKTVLVTEMSYPRKIFFHIMAHSDELSKQRRKAFKDLCLTELKELINLPEVASDEKLNRYAHIMLGLHDGSHVSQRFKLENLADKLELQILHSITGDDVTKLKAFLKIVCLYGNKLLIYRSEDNKVLEKLCSLI